MPELLSHLDDDTRRIVAMATAADLAAPVPSCDGWTLADLIWHLAEVQTAWAWVLEHRPSGLDEGYEEPARPDDAELPATLDAARHRLVSLLAELDPAEPAWSWAGDHTVGFTLRRQAHEALLHRVDAELAVGVPPSVDVELAADGVDELLTVFLGDLPAWARFTASDDAVEVTLDGGASWICRLGRMTGTSPDSGRSYELDAVVLDTSAPVRARVSGPAGAVLLWLWGRGSLGDLAVTGDPSSVTRLRQLVAEATQ